jgi:alkaline phosphatase
MKRVSTLMWIAVTASACASQPPATEATQARNVILFVGDGMGIATVTAARILDGQRRGDDGEENALAFEKFPYTALSKTYTLDYQVGESAGTMTAMMSGRKTLSAKIGADGSTPAGDCAGLARSSMPTLLELAEDRGLATGVVTTTRITHATPAATYAHSPHRDWEFDGTIPPNEAARGCRDIARQLVEFDHGDGIDVVLGGGRALFRPTDAEDPELAGVFGVRRDGRDLVSDWQRRYPNGAFVWSQGALAQVDAAKTSHLLGLFEPDHMRFEADRPRDPGGEPSLAEMTAKAIAMLARNRNGFFLMVEGGRIDHGHHAGNAYRALTDTIAFAEAVAVAVAATSVEDTLIIVTADHSHTLTINGYPAKGNPIFGLARNTDGSLQLDGTRQPYTTLSYANGPGSHLASDQQPAGSKRLPHMPKSFEQGPIDRADLREVDTTAPDYLQESLVPLASETHGGEDVPVYARGPGSDQVRGVIEQNEIFHIMKRAYGW